MAKYTVLTPVEHNGDPYPIDAEIYLDDAFAKPLLEVGAIILQKQVHANQDAPATGGGKRG